MQSFDHNMTRRVRLWMNNESDIHPVVLEYAAEQLRQDSDNPVDDVENMLRDVLRQRKDKLFHQSKYNHPIMNEIFEVALEYVDVRSIADRYVGIAQRERV